MARKRMIDPSFWEDPTIGSLSVPARLLFIGMMSHADDEGRLEVEPRYIRRAVFGFDEDVPTGVVAAFLDEIKTLCRGVRFYEVDGRALACFTNWKRYQYIQKPQPSKLPPPPESTPMIPIPDEYDTATVSVQPNRIEKNRIEVSGGERARENGSAADTISRLMRCGLDEKQARTAIRHQDFPPDLLDRLELWASKIRDANKKPGAILCGYTNNGTLPDDLPRPKRPSDDFRVYRADGSIDTDATNKRLKENPGLMWASAR